jgi:hypothetical protein
MGHTKLNTSSIVESFSCKIMYDFGRNFLTIEELYIFFLFENK